ncbi:hypothetical protein ACP70R_027882 [Stipagrostis hirtigluma subsp. patula]
MARFCASILGGFSPPPTLGALRDPGSSMRCLRRRNIRVDWSRVLQPNQFPWRRQLMQSAHRLDTWASSCNP